MTPIYNKISTFNFCLLLMLFFWSIFIPSAQGANLATIKIANWRVDKAKLIVKGKLALAGSSVMVSDAESAVFLGTTIAGADGFWRLVLKNPTMVPCSVQAETDGSINVRAVKNAPTNCGSGSGSIPPTDPVNPLIAQGEALFFNETFGGNGRTCGTCHRAENNFTIDPAFIATLPANDSLFVAESNPDLVELEDPVLLRQFGLIRANVDGFEDPAVKFVARSVSHLFGMGSTIRSNTTTAPLEMTGWSGDGAPNSGTLRDFATGAVIQHFTKTLNRVAGVDFRLPTDAELDALLAYQLSLGVPATLNLQDLRLTNTAAERGRVLFITEDSENGSKRAAKCNACHRNAGALTVAGINQNFDTGVEDAIHDADLTGALRPRDGGFGIQFDAATGDGFGDGTFNPPPLVHAADTAPFFHNNVAATLEDAIAHYESNEFRMSPEGQRLQLADSGGRELSVDVDTLAAFLRVINVMENIRSSVAHLELAKTFVTAVGIQKVLNQSMLDLNDVHKVLTEGKIHEEVIPVIDDARALVNSAMLEPAVNVAERNNFIDLAITTAQTGRDLMVAVLPAIDTEAPLVTITAPDSSLPIFGSVAVTADASDDIAISALIFKLGSIVIGQDNLAPFEVALNTADFPDGNTTLTVTAVDTSDNSTTTTLPLIIDNANAPPPPDITSPIVTITAPSDGSTVAGDVLITVDASDDTGIASVVYSVSGAEIGQSIMPPHEQPWDTTTFTDDNHTLTVTAFDAAGNSTISNISAIVENSSAPPPECTVYSCPSPPPPPSEPPPEPIIPIGTSPDGEFEGVVTGVDFLASTVSVDSGGTVVTLKITSDTEFAGSVASSIGDILVGHVAQGEFFQSTSETVWIDVDLPPGF